MMTSTAGGGGSAATTSATNGSLDASSSRRDSNIPNSGFMGDTNLPMGDKLILRGLLFHGFHGVKLEEKKLGQKFLVDVDAWIDLQQAGKTDALSETISYVEIYRIVSEIVEGPSQNLLESVANLIADTTLNRYPRITAIRVKVGKPDVADHDVLVHGHVDYLGVEILRFNKHD